MPACRSPATQDGGGACCAGALGPFTATCCRTWRPVGSALVRWGPVSPGSTGEPAAWMSAALLVWGCGVESAGRRSPGPVRHDGPKIRTASPPPPGTGARLAPRGQTTVTGARFCVADVLEYRSGEGLTTSGGTLRDGTAATMTDCGSCPRANRHGVHGGLRCRPAAALRAVRLE